MIGITVTSFSHVPAPVPCQLSEPSPLPTIPSSSSDRSPNKPERPTTLLIPSSLALRTHAIRSDPLSLPPCCPPYPLYYLCFPPTHRLYALQLLPSVLHASQHPFHARTCSVGRSTLHSNHKASGSSPAECMGCQAAGHQSFRSSAVSQTQRDPRVTSIDAAATEPDGRKRRRMGTGQPSTADTYAYRKDYERTRRKSSSSSAVFRLERRFKKLSDTPAVTTCFPLPRTWLSNSRDSSQRKTSYAVSQDTGRKNTGQAFQEQEASYGGSVSTGRGTSRMETHPRTGTRAHANHGSRSKSVCGYPGYWQCLKDRVFYNTDATGQCCFFLSSLSAEYSPVPAFMSLHMQIPYIFLSLQKLRLITYPPLSIPYTRLLLYYHLLQCITVFLYAWARILSTRTPIRSETSERDTIFRCSYLKSTTEKCITRKRHAQLTTPSVLLTSKTKRSSTHVIWRDI